MLGTDENCGGGNKTQRDKKEYCGDKKIIGCFKKIKNNWRPRKNLKK